MRILFQSLIKSNKNGKEIIKFKNVPNSFVAVFDVDLAQNSKNAIDKLKLIVDFWPNDFSDRFLAGLTFSEINYLLLCTDEEERKKWNCGVFDVPGFGKLNFAGFSGIRFLFGECLLKYDSKHPLISSILEGDFLIEYYLIRVRRISQNCQAFVSMFEDFVKKVKDLPFFLKPKFVLGFIDLVFKALMLKMPSSNC